MKRIKTLITRQGSGSREDRSPTEETATTPESMKSIEHTLKEEREFPNDPMKDAEVLESIEKVYFGDETFDSNLHELNKLPELDQLDLNKVGQDRDLLRRQLNSVSKKVSDLVLENHSAYSKELHRVTNLQASLQTANIICSNGRRQLEMAKQGFTVASLSILANHKKRLQLLSLLKSLHTIKTLQRTDIRLREMMEEENYPEAIQLCLECQKAASTFRHYRCISELSSKLQDTMEMIEEQLDQALAKTCSNFDIEHYEKVQTAYQLLGKTQTAMDQLHMHYTSAIHNTAFTIVVGYVELVSGSQDTNFQKMHYRDLCTHITTDTYIPCLVDLCKALWEVMKSYHKIIEWHETNDEPISPTLQESDVASDLGNVEAQLNKKYIKQKLTHGLTRIWQDVQQKVKLYLLGTDLSSFKYDDFIYVLDLVNRLITVGEEFCGSKSEGLHDSIRQQSLNYFKNYHRARIEELQMFLENEGWELCPVRANFTALNLHEFRYLRQAGISQPGKGAPASPSPKRDHCTRSGYFTKYGAQGSPFDREMDDEEGEDVIATNGYEDEERDSQGNESDDSDVPDELKQEYIDEHTEDQQHARSSLKRRKSDRTHFRGPVAILSNTTLNILRLFGKYMQMVAVLKPIAFDVVICMSQLFDYYLYAVYTFFSTDLSDALGLSLSNKIRTTLQRINDNLINNEPPAGMMPNPMENKEKVGFPHISPMVNLTGMDKLHGLAERVVGTESLVFLAEQFQSLQSHLEGVIPASKKPFLQQFYSQTVSVASELRRPVYRGVASRCIDFEKILQLMFTVKWDIKDIMSQHSAYVDVLLQEFQIFSNRLTDVNRRVPVPTEVYTILWEHIIRLANRTFVEGYASARKCSNEGRALMQLDFQQFLLKLETLTEIRPIPDKEYVETYVKAYYLSEADMESWIKEHREYSSKQLTSLINCAINNKKARQRLLASVEDMERARVR
ncbi:syndetin-like isoform X2 [Amphiura filiformis]|uniref:syndetin-like isoform X2 n=1 Tax=Amphiura filiformis TaxID=82378 RepID=UPI003B22685B